MGHQTNQASDGRPWLEEKVYGPKRRRTYGLVKKAVDELRKGKERISIETVAARTMKVDPEGRGVSRAAILGNDQARAYYKQHRSWKPRYQVSGARKSRTSASLSYIKSDRDLNRVRYRYSKLSKTELVERLIAAEQAYAEQEEKWLQNNEELMAGLYHNNRNNKS